MNKECSIRLAVAQDNEPIRAMIFGVLDEFGVEAEPDGDDLDATEFGLNLDRIYIVAEIAGAPIGSAVLTSAGGGDVKLSKLFLGPSSRGKGIGQALLTASVAEARKAGFTRIYLRTRDSYEAAIRLYEKSGWERHPEPLPPPGAPVMYSLAL